MKAVGIIPARYKSTRFPGKPLADICGQPMIYHVWKRAVESKLLNDVYVATDDQRIYEACEERSVPCLMTSEDSYTGTDRVAEAAAQVESDVYVNIQGDEPMIRPQMIDAAIVPVFESQGEIPVTNLCTRVRTQADLTDNSVIKVVKSPESYAIYYSRLPIPYPKEREGLVYYKQVCVYAFMGESLKKFRELGPLPLEIVEGIEFLRYIESGIPIKLVEVEEDTVSVDTPSDLRSVVKIMSQQGAA